MFQKRTSGTACSHENKTRNGYWNGNWNRKQKSSRSFFRWTNLLQSNLKRSCLVLIFIPITISALIPSGTGIVFPFLPRIHTALWRFVENHDSEMLGCHNGIWGLRKKFNFLAFIYTYTYSCQGIICMYIYINTLAKATQIWAWSKLCNDDICSHDCVCLMHVRMYVQMHTKYIYIYDVHINIHTCKCIQIYI